MISTYTSKPLIRLYPINMIHVNKRDEKAILLGAFACSGFSQPQWISVAKSAKLRKSTTEKRDLKKHLSLSVVICDQKHANRISRLKVVANVKVTTERLDYYVEIMNRERSFGSNDELELGEDKSDPIKVHPELHSVSSPRPCVRMLVTKVFPDTLVASTVR